MLKVLRTAKGIFTEALSYPSHVIDDCFDVVSTHIFLLAETFQLITLRV